MEGVSLRAEGLEEAGAVPPPPGMVCLTGKIIWEPDGAMCRLAMWFGGWGHVDGNSLDRGIAA